MNEPTFTYRGHLLRGNKKNEIPGRFVVFDTEGFTRTDDRGRITLSPFLWCASYYRISSKAIPAPDTQPNHVAWSTVIPELWDFITGRARAGTRLWVFAHNLAVDFAPTLGFGELSKRGWSIVRMVAHDRLATITYRKGEATIVFSNTGSIFPGSIKLWGYALGLPKLPQPDYSDHITRWVEYCQRDVAILARMLLTWFKFLRDHDLGNFQPTIAGQAFNAFRHRFMTHKITIHDEPDVIELERQAYHGGRIEALKVGDFAHEQFYLVDVRSMYPTIMRDHEVPIELRGYQPRLPIDALNPLLERYAVIAECEIYPSEPAYPRMNNDKSVYDDMPRVTVLSTPELQYAAAKGWINKVGRVAWYKKGYALRAYAEYFMALRHQYEAENNIPYTLMAKLLANSLYGKFGQYGYLDLIAKDAPPDLVASEEHWLSQKQTWVTLLAYGGHWHMMRKTPRAYNAFIAIAAHITAYGRMQMWHMMRAADISNVYHVAVDSMIVSRIGYERLVAAGFIGEQPGQARVERIATTLTVRAPNDLRIGDTERIKGVSDKDEQIDAHTYRQMWWRSLHSIVSEGDHDIVAKIVVKHLGRARYRALKEREEK
jgi:hypothetical protein